MPAHAQGSEGMPHTGETLWEARENRSGGEKAAQIAPFTEASTAALMAVPGGTYGSAKAHQTEKSGSAALFSMHELAAAAEETVVIAASSAEEEKNDDPQAVIAASASVVVAAEETTVAVAAA